MINALFKIGTTTEASIDMYADPDIPQNGNVVIDNDPAMHIRIPGVYEFSGVIELKSTKSGMCGAYIAANGEQVGNLFYRNAEAADEAAIIPISAVLNVSPSTDNNYVEIQVFPIGSPSVEGGNLTIKEYFNY